MIVSFINRYSLSLFETKNISKNISLIHQNDLVANHQRLPAVFQNVDCGGNDVRRVQPASAGAYPLATLGPELR